MTTRHGSQTYVLRVWSENEHGHPPAFRAALTNVATKETVYFSDAVTLADYLRALHDQGASPG